MTGGLEGADVDTLDVPPFGNQTTIIYLDLDRLDTELDVETITALYVIDGSGGGDVNVIEVFSLQVDGAIPVPEPARWLLLLSGAVLLSGLARLRAAESRT